LDASLLDPPAVVSRMDEPLLLDVDSGTAEPWPRVNAPPAQHDHQQQRDSDNEPSEHQTSLRAGPRSSRYALTFGDRCHRPTK
jgi:hypothetical protein